MISAASSGSGKTTVMTALLKALVNKKFNTAAFKSGPDYIDPMFHRRVLNVPSRNLDQFMLGDDNCRYILGKNGRNADVSIIEGVMGYYDGLGAGTFCSSYELAKLLDCPVILVINCEGMAVSVCAVIEGFKNFRENSNIRGVILNNVSQYMYPFYKNIIESNTDVKVYGYMPYLEDCKLESRHLGLVTAQEVGNLEHIVNKLGNAASQTIDIDNLLFLAESAPLIEYKEPPVKNLGKIEIAVAYDRAFCFYYQDSLELLEQMGARLVKFSPLNDNRLPEGVCGVYIGGGYPELYMDALSENKAMLKDVKEKIYSGMPVFAECGGYMYLLDSFEAKDKNKIYNLAGTVCGQSFMTDKLSHFGYVTLTALRDNLMCKKGGVINGHEFHYSDSTNRGNSFSAKKPNSDVGWSCIIADETKFMGYPHINLLGNIDFAENLVKKCIEYGENL